MRSTCTSSASRMARCTGSRAAAPTLLLLLLGACNTTPMPGSPPDKARFESCQDPAGQQAFDRALVHIQAGRDAEALPLLQSCVRSCPELVRAHQLYQQTALQVGGDAERQMRAYYEAMTPSPADIVIAYAKARLLDSAYARNQALEAILRYDRSFYYAHLSQARLYRSSGRLSDAIQGFQRALALNGDLLPAHLELAETLVESGRDAEAAVHFANYLRGAPLDLPVVRAYVSLLVYRLGRPDEAMPLIEQLLQRDPQDLAALMDKAAALWRKGDPEPARQIYLGVLERRPDNARAALNLGYLCYEALPQDEAGREQWWPKAAAAFRMYERLARPEDGLDYVEQLLAVPYRLKEIDAFLRQHGAAPAAADKTPTLADLRD